MFFLEYAHASYLCEMSADPPDEYVSPWHLLMFKLEIDLAAQIGHCQLGKNPVIVNEGFFKTDFFRHLKQLELARPRRFFFRKCFKLA